MSAESGSNSTQPNKKCQSLDLDFEAGRYVGQCQKDLDESGGSCPS